MLQIWQSPYQFIRDQPPSPLLKKALGFVPNRDAALSLGVGDGSGVKYLLSEGFKKVTAVKKQPLPQNNFWPMPEANLEFVCLPYDQFQFPLQTFSLIHAPYSLPFCPPMIFSVLWKRVKKSLLSSGIFTGQFFGVKDEWNRPETRMVFHTVAQVKDLFIDMEILEFRYEQRDDLLSNGHTKHWHIFHVIARAK